MCVHFTDTLPTYTHTDMHEYTGGIRVNGAPECPSQSGISQTDESQQRQPPSAEPSSNDPAEKRK